MRCIIGVRGSLVVVEVEGSVDAPQSHVTAVEASLPILVAPRADPARTTALNPNEAVTVAGPPRPDHVIMALDELPDLLDSISSY